MHLHQKARGFFVGRIEIDDRRRDILPRVGRDVCCNQSRAEASHQPVMDGLTFGKYPDPKRRIKIVETFENMLLKIWSVEQQRMDAAVFRGFDDAFDIDLD